MSQDKQAALEADLAKLGYRLSFAVWPKAELIEQVTTGRFTAIHPVYGPVNAKSAEKLVAFARKQNDRLRRLEPSGVEPGPEPDSPDQPEPKTGRGRVAVARGAAGSEYLQR